MTHDQIQDLLEAYVDETLDRATRKMVDDHIADCRECQSILEDVEPVDMSSMGPRGYDEHSMRRVVRRSILRTALDTVVLLFGGLVVVTLLATLIYQPFIINRGGRSADVARATIDLATMLNPGAVVTEVLIQSDLFDREVSVEVVLPVGARSEVLGSFGVRIGAFNLSDVDGGRPWPILGPQGFESNAEDQLSHLGPGTVSTVRIDFGTPISASEAQSIADASSQEIRVVWAGFDVSTPTGDPPSWAAGQVPGYATCIGAQPLDNLDEAFLGEPSAGFNRSLPDAPSSITRALDLLREGLNNIASNPEIANSLLDGSSESVHDVDQTLARLAEPDPRVKVLVITGPSPEVADYLSESMNPEDSAQVLAVNFYNWTTSVCGR